MEDLVIVLQDENEVEDSMVGLNMGQSDEQSLESTSCCCCCCSCGDA